MPSMYLKLHCFLEREKSTFNCHNNYDISIFCLGRGGGVGIALLVVIKSDLVQTIKFMILSPRNSVVKNCTKILMSK